ncbi:MAG: ACT domain-containing protein [Deltaproteobacteria bacterium]|nr:ACT domain-containing protein [Deltaproteobacteria bacterium]
MKAEQISVFLENKSGRLAEVMRVLGAAQVNIRALSIADTSDFGILRIIVNDKEKALAALKENNFTVSKTEVVAVEVPDTPGGLSKILDLLDAKKVNVEYMYAFIERHSENALIIFRFDENDRAIEVLQKAGITILSSQEVYNR